jgi:hypothetical protein
MDGDGGYPPGANIRVYNLNQDNIKQIQQEYTKVTLQAGYVNGNYGAVFNGTIKMIRTGRLSAIDSYVDILAADGDEANRFAVGNVAVKSGWAQAGYAKALGQSMEQYGTKVNTDGLASTGGVVGIRGKTSWGLASAGLNNVARNNYGTYSIRDGEWKFTKLDGYADGEIVVLNSNTGMIGVPEATSEGVEVTCLLNPKIQLGGRVQINNADINQTTVKEPGYPTFGNRPYFASVTADGVYRALVVEHMGDTRGQEWYTTITALALDGNSGQVSPYGYQGVPSRASNTPGGVGNEKEGSN